MKHVSFFRKDYPRPQFVREQYELLNGDWAFSFDDQNIGEKEGWYKRTIKDLTINVPFAYQTALSKINIQKDHIYMWYQKEIDLYDIKENEDQLIVFEGADYHTKAWINDYFIGEHFGGYTRFSFSLRDYILAHKGERKATLTLRIVDDISPTKPRGKQSWTGQPFGCWYTPTSGIYKTVWMEKVSYTRFKNIFITPDENKYSFNVDFELLHDLPNLKVDIDVSFEGTFVSSSSVRTNRSQFNTAVSLATNTDGFQMQFWTPDKPSVYEFDITLKDENNNVLDEVKMYSGYRTFKKERNLFLLNQNPVYLRLVLEQGYYENSGITAPSYEDLEKEIKLIKELGFNGMRVHQKIEDERFMYLADVYGLFAWCENPSAYEFRYSTIESQTKEWIDIVRDNYNHPSIIVWVPINESWGVPHIRTNPAEQSYANALYNITKAIDPYRLVISNDGWEHTTSDIITLHNYEQEPEAFKAFYEDFDAVLNGNNISDYNQTRRAFANGYSYHDEPVMMDEFIGTAFSGQTKENDGAWGYGTSVKNNDEFIKRFDGLIKAVVKNSHFSGFCVTQLTDVYQEMNGLLNFDRTPKIDISLLKKIITQR